MEKSSSEKTRTAERPPTRLGRGLSALLPPASPAPPSAAPAGGTAATEGVRELPISAIVTNVYQPRTVFDPVALADLTASVRAHGVLQPVLVRPRAGGRFELVAGERRLRAAADAGLSRVPAVVRSLTDAESLTVALIENIQREDLNPMEAARGYKQLMEEFGLTQTQLGQQIGKKQSTISNVMSLLKLPQEVQDSIADGRISAEHGKILLGLDNPVERMIVWRDFVDLKMSRKDARDHTRAAKTLTSPPAVEKDADWRRLEERFRYALGAKVDLAPAKSGGGGVLTVRCATQEELEGILEKLRG